MPDQSPIDDDFRSQIIKATLGGRQPAPKSEKPGLTASLLEKVMENKAKKALEQDEAANQLRESAVKPENIDMVRKIMKGML